MSNYRTFLFSMLVLAVVGLSGCYPNRWTTQYNSLINSIEADNSILEESGQDDESEKRRIEELERLADEEGIAYHINAGDQIDVRVYGHPDLNTITKVSPDGSIGMVFVGQLIISGLTISEARDAIAKGLEPYVKHPVVGVSVLEVSSETITISGAVAKPGMYNISASSRLADAYAMAGSSAKRLYNGTDVDVADLTRSIIVRDSKILPVDFTAAIAQGDKLNNIKLRKGDYIFIAQRMESSIIVCGDVRNPHRRMYEPSMTLIEILTVAGWMNETHWSNVIIIRGSMSNPKMFKVNVDAILAGKSNNIALKANDIVYVPKDDLAEYNVFIRKLMPTFQLLNLMSSKVSNTIEL
ncbi:MAG: polysaccharide biosynthesis/export family protein [Victivallales bacterium]|nr:polysaccharide biosynthesis/export family protein [Victivallales bacterium]